MYRLSMNCILILNNCKKSLNSCFKFLTKSLKWCLRLPIKILELIGCISVKGVGLFFKIIDSFDIGNFCYMSLIFLIIGLWVVMIYGLVGTVRRPSRIMEQPNETEVIELASEEVNVIENNYEADKLEKDMETLNNLIFVVPEDEKIFMNLSDAEYFARLYSRGSYVVLSDFEKFKYKEHYFKYYIRRYYMEGYYLEAYFKDLESDTKPMYLELHRVDAEKYNVDLQEGIEALEKWLEHYAF